MKNLVTPVLGLVFTALFSFSATATPIATNTWNVKSTGKINCTGSPHGLWTNQLRVGGGTCKQYYDFQSGSKLTQYDDGTAHLLATAKNNGNVLASIDIWFGGFQDTYAHTKNGGGPTLADWDFYTTIQSGSKISILGIDYFVSVHDRGGNNASTGGSDDFVFQIGTGANDKTGAFGGSSWLDVFYTNADGSRGSYTGGHHWDLNMDFMAAPEPGLLGLLALSLVGIGVRRRLR